MFLSIPLIGLGIFIAVYIQNKQFYLSLQNTSPEIDTVQILTYGSNQDLQLNFYRADLVSARAIILPGFLLDHTAHHDLAIALNAVGCEVAVVEIGYKLTGTDPETYQTNVKMALNYLEDIWTDPDLPLILIGYSAGGGHAYRLLSDGFIADAAVLLDPVTDSPLSYEQYQQNATSMTVPLLIQSAPSAACNRFHDNLDPLEIQYSKNQFSIVWAAGSHCSLGEDRVACYLLCGKADREIYNTSIELSSLWISSTLGLDESQSNLESTLGRLLSTGQIIQAQAD